MTSKANDRDGDKANKQSLQQTYRANPFYARVLHPLLDSKDNRFWTQPTKVWCWYCAGRFSNPPFPLPTNCSNGIFTTMGVYCSLTCVKSDIKNKAGYFMGQRLEWLTLMAADVYNCHDDIPTIDRYRFEHFGGDLAHADYLRMHAVVPTIQLRSFPFVDAPFVFEQPFKDEEISKMHIHPVISTSSVQSLSSGAGQSPGLGSVSGSGSGSETLPMPFKSQDVISSSEGVTGRRNAPPPNARAVKFPGFEVNNSDSTLKQRKPSKQETNEDVLMTDAAAGPKQDATLANSKKLAPHTPPSRKRKPAAPEGKSKNNKRKMSAARNLKSSLERKAAESIHNPPPTPAADTPTTKNTDSLLELMNIGASRRPVTPALE